jgi:hypothetical protein
MAHWLWEKDAPGGNFSNYVARHPQAPSCIIIRLCNCVDFERFSCFTTGLLQTAAKAHKMKDNLFLWNARGHSEDWRHTGVIQTMLSYKLEGGGGREGQPTGSW